MYANFAEMIEHLSAQHDWHSGFAFYTVNTIDYETTPCQFAFGAIRRGMNLSKATQNIWHELLIDIDGEHGRDEMERDLQVLSTKGNG